MKNMNDQMILKLPHEYSMTAQNQLIQSKIAQNQKLFDLRKWFKKNYPQLVTRKLNVFKLEQMYNFIQQNGGLYAKPKPKQAPKKEQMFREIEYYVKLSEAHQAGKKLPKEHLMNLFKMELQQTTPCQRKFLLEDFKIGKEFRETMRN